MADGKKKEVNVSAIEQVLSPAIAGFGYELIFSELGRAGSKTVLRLFIDKPGGVTIGDCEKVSREVEPILDAEDFFPGQYLLEVSSPGVDRPLRPKDFPRFLGQRAKIELKAPRENRRKLVGVIEKVDEQSVTVILEKDQRFAVTFEEIKRANLIWDGESPPQSSEPSR